MRRFLIPCLVLACLVQPAMAEGESSAKVGAPGTNVEMPFLIAPMSNDGKLLGYSYISSKLVATSQSAAIDVRDKLAFIQDAFVRDVNAKPIGTAADPTQVDTSLLNSRLSADAARIVGSDKVVRLVFMDIKFSPLHPGDSTLNLVPPSERAPTAGQEPSPEQLAKAPAGASGTTSQPANQPAKAASH